MTAAVAEGLFLHASAVVVGGGALLFLGHSTAGKSTLARLLGKNHPVLADDSVFAARDTQGGWRVVDGSFRFGRDVVSGWQEAVRRRAVEGPSIPLRGCFRIHKAASARVEPFAPLNLARCLMDAAMEVDMQRKFGRPREGGGEAACTFSSVRQMRRQWFRWVAEIARACPGGNLWFSRDSKEADLLAMFIPLLERRSGPI
jgi:hypothetical protein